MSFLDIGIYDAHVVSYLELLKHRRTPARTRAGIMLSSHKPVAKKILTYHRIPITGLRGLQTAANQASPNRNG